MAPLKILSFLALIVVVSSLSDASSRILKADENPNSEKDLPVPAPVLPQNNKEQNQNLQPGKKDDEGKKESGGNLKSEESGKNGDEPLNSGNDGKKSDEHEGSSANLENSNMGDGQNGSNDPSKNVKGDGEKGSSDSEKDKMGDRQNGSSDPLKKNEESGKKGDGKKGSDNPTKNAFTDKSGDGKNGNNDPTREEENGGKKGVGKKESSPATKKEETGKKGGEQREGNDPSKNGENDNKGNDPLKNEVGGEKGDGKKGSSDPSKSGGSSEKGDGKKGSSDPSKSGGSSEKGNGKKGSTDPSKSGGSSEKGDGKKGSNDPSKSGRSSEKDDQHKGKEEPRKEEVIPQSCDAKCDEQDFVACLQHTEIGGSQEFFLHVQNKRGKSLTVNITVPTSVKVDGKPLNIPEHGIQKVKVEATKSLKVTLDSEKGHCQLQIGIDQSVGIGPSINGWNPFNQLSSTQLMPIYGGFLLVILAIVGGVWGFCMFRRRRRAVSGIPYQQLEMGSQVQSSTAIESSSADGWDQSWNDDWDEEEATRVSNSSLNNRSLSSNGLSSRSPNKKNDWDIDWDD